MEVKKRHFQKEGYIMEEMFKYLDYLEDFYKKEFISLDNYFHIKECIIESYRPVKVSEESEESDLPF